MSAITVRNDVFQRMGRGLGTFMPFLCQNHTATTTGGAAASGFHSLQMFLNALGTTQPNTLVGLPLPPSLSGPLRLVLSQTQVSSARVGFLAYFYKIGTVDLTAAAGSEMFTHDSAGFPVKRTKFGVANTAVNLLPMLYITTATATTAPAFIIRNPSGPAAGYTNQAGAGVTGTKTITLPSATTTVASGFMLRMENGDSGVQDVSNIESVTAGSAGAGIIFGLELLVPLGFYSAGLPSVYDALFGGVLMRDLAPAVPTSGTLTGYLGILSIGTGGNVNLGGVIGTVLDT